MARQTQQGALRQEDLVISPRMAASRRNGAAGGRARRQALTDEQRQAIGEKGGAALVARYGHSFFSYMRKCRKRKSEKAG